LVRERAQRVVVCIGRQGDPMEAHIGPEDIRRPDVRPSAKLHRADALHLAELFPKGEADDAG
jgi:hypothetical protein